MGSIVPRAPDAQRKPPGKTEVLLGGVQRARGQGPGPWGADSELAVVSGLAVRGDVQAFTLVFFANAQTDGQINNLVGNE